MSRLPQAGKPVARWKVFLLVAIAIGFPAGAQQPPAAAAAPSPHRLNLLVIEGEGALNNIRRRTAREPIVQVVDENHKPVAGATVVFLLPGSGPGGTFANGSRQLTVRTDAMGRAKATGLRSNKNVGEWQIQVQLVSAAEATTTAIGITQHNVLGPHLLFGSIPVTAVTVAVAGAVVGGLALGLTEAFNGGNSKSAKVSAGTPSLP